MRSKYLALNDPLYQYLLTGRSDAGDPVLEALRQETEALGDDARMQISREQGSFLSVLAGVLGVRSALEIGTFTGYSSLCLARGLSPGGRLICLDASREWTDIARRYWRQAGVEDRIELRLGPALEALRGMEANLGFDLVFIDADKTQYDDYYELVLPRVRPNGLILFDNMLWGGRVIESPPQEDAARAIVALNRKLAEDSRVETVLLSIADGIQFCRKR